MLKDILEESWTFQEIRQEALEQGREEGQWQTMRQTLLFFIQTHFPALMPLAQDSCEAIQTPKPMQDLLQNILIAKDDQEVQQYLLNTKGEKI